MKFLSALAADGTIPDVEGIISSNLSAGFDSLKENVSESMARQEKILAAVQVCGTVSCEDVVVEGTTPDENAWFIYNSECFLLSWQRFPKIRTARLCPFRVAFCPCQN